VSRMLYSKRDTARRFNKPITFIYELK